MLDQVVPDRLRTLGCVELGALPGLARFACMSGNGDDRMGRARSFLILFALSLELADDGPEPLVESGLP